MMTHEEIEANRRELSEILRKRHPDGKYKPEVKGELQKLADKVGATTQTVFPNIIQGGARYVRDAEECELAYNIHHALQTASMIDACRTAAKNHEVALAATKEAAESRRTSKYAMIAAWVAAVGAWAVVFVPHGVSLIRGLLNRQP